jgi:hypothetical protein
MAICRHLDHNTHSVGDIMGSTELWPVFPSNHFKPKYLVPCATPVHYLQVSAAKTFKASYLQMAKMAKEEKGYNRTHINNLHCEALELPVQFQIETAHWGTLVVDCCIPHSTASEYLTTQNLMMPNFFFGKIYNAGHTTAERTISTKHGSQGTCCQNNCLHTQPHSHHTLRMPLLTQTATLYSLIIATQHVSQIVSIISVICLAKLDPASQALADP